MCANVRAEDLGLARFTVCGGKFYSEAVDAPLATMFCDHVFHIVSCIMTCRITQCHIGDTTLSLLKEGLDSPRGEGE